MQSKLIGTLAHDIRNPLAAARLGIEMFSLKPGAEHIARVQKMTMKSVDKALDMIEGLLDSITVNAGEGMMLVFSETDIFPDIQTIYEEANTVYDEEIILDCKDKEINGILIAEIVELRYRPYNQFSKIRVFVFIFWQKSLCIDIQKVREHFITRDLFANNLFALVDLLDTNFDDILYLRFIFAFIKQRFVEFTIQNGIFML